ncbi:MAG: VCBS repeat-containing protein [Bacteroidetes bacterium]|nr:VCBS repeat-containing protein [Bacteroidota bacterium]MBS1931775.1 VCBS repeat-containing protein [Bacteroidota bacterium]
MQYWLKIFSSVILFVFLSGNAHANRIDSLKTDEDVVAFLKSINPDFSSDKYKQIELHSTDQIRKDLACDGIATQWQIQNWEKADFNGDGRTDLLVLLYWYDYGVYSVIDNGDGTFKFLTLSYNIYEKCELAKAFKENNQQLLLYYQKIQKWVKTKNNQGYKLYPEMDTLIYKYGGFVERNFHLSNYAIDSIEFRTSACYGSCPVFSIALDKKGNGVYNAKTYNPKQGTFTTLLDKENLNKIIGLINYISINDLQDNYRVSWTDDQTCWVRIRFTDGSIKEIEDYGLKGTFGLRLLYSIFFDLRGNQNWR